MLFNWFLGAREPHSRRIRGHKLASFRPRFEMLEERNLLSTYAVDHLADDMVGDGLNGSLRYCITNAVDGDHIQFGVNGTINLTGALPVLTHSISIDGPGANLLTVRRNTGGSYRIFSVASGTTVSISGLTVADGAGILNSGTLTLNNSTVSGNGGVGNGITNYGMLTVNNSTVSNNSADNEGGGIYNGYTGVLTVNNSTISANQAYDYDCIWVFGGGIYNDGMLTVNNSTVSGNSAEVGGGIYSFGTVIVNNSTVSGNAAWYSYGGGGIANGGTFTLNNSTVSGNSAYGADASGGGIANSGAMTVRNTIIAGNTTDFGPGPDLSGSLGSQGHNLIGNTQGGSGFAASDLLNVSPLLGPLQDNGGATKTMALLAGSPALNAGDSSQLGVADQRGVVRSGGVNIGAYQASASAVLFTVSAPVTAGVPFTITVTVQDAYGNTAIGYMGTVHFTAYNGGALVAMADYTFPSTDSGQHTFTELVLHQPGDYTITGSDPDAGIDGSVSFAVDPA
jgi:hypothetical protein